MQRGLKHYRLTDYRWIDEEQARLGTERFWQIVDTMHRLLQNLPVGGQFNVAKRTQPENHNLVVKICCEWILTVPGYNFDESYTTITRYKFENRTQNKKQNKQ